MKGFKEFSFIFGSATLPVEVPNQKMLLAQCTHFNILKQLSHFCFDLPEPTV
jgi:hypothetical protein